MEYFFLILVDKIQRFVNKIIENRSEILDYVFAIVFSVCLTLLIIEALI